MWSTTGWTNTTVTITTSPCTMTSGTCPWSSTCRCEWFRSVPVEPEPFLLRIPRHDWWNLYHRDLHDEIRLPIAAPVSVRVARRLQPGNLHERRMQKRKRNAQRLRVQ